MRPKHSPRPWKLVKHVDMGGSLRFLSVTSANTNTVAEVFVQDSPDGSVGVEEIHNAYLISTAPELLETLELVETWMLATKQGEDLMGLVRYTLLRATGKIGLDNPKEGML